MSRAYVVNSKYMRLPLANHGIPRSKVHVVYNAADFDETIRCPGIVAPRTVPTFGLVGQVVERKGHHIAIEALAKIRARHPALAFKLMIFGGGSEAYIDQIKELAAAKGLTRFIHWCGYNTNRDEIYPEIDFSLVPTIDPEPFAHVTIEPAVYGKPIIASATGGTPEIVKDGVTGFLVPPADADALAERITRLLLEPNLADVLGQQAYSDYKARFNAPAFIDGYCRIIEGLLGR